MNDLHTHLSKDIFNMPTSYNGEAMDEEMIEWLAERDEALFETYMNTGYERTIWHKKFLKAFRNGEVYPCLRGAALQGVGIQEFLNHLHMVADVDYDPATPFVGRVYKVRHDVHGNRLTYIK